MPPVQPGASVASTGLGIRYIGEFAYAYNYQEVTDSDTTFFDFTTGAGILQATLQAFGTDQSGNDFNLTIKFNDIAVVTSRGASASALAADWFPIYLVIPPQTKVTVTLINVSAATGRDWWLTMSGRVYGTE